jgi:hypothetical protein
MILLHDYLPGLFRQQGPSLLFSTIALPGRIFSDKKPGNSDKYLQLLQVNMIGFTKSAVHRRRLSGFMPCRVD